MLPLTVLGLFVHDAIADEISCLALIGPSGPIHFQNRMALGQGLSGWVAYEATDTELELRLDLGDVARDSECELRSTASVPLVLDDRLVGVLTVYSEQAGAFTEQHLKVLSLLAPRLAQAVSRCIQFDQETSAHLWDHETGLPNAKDLRQYLAFSTAARGLSEPTGSLLLLKVRSRSAVTYRGAQSLRPIADAVRGSLRLGDSVFRLRDDEIVCILHGADSVTARFLYLHGLLIALTVPLRALRAVLSSWSAALALQTTGQRLTSWSQPSWRLR